MDGEVLSLADTGKASGLNECSDSGIDRRLGQLWASFYKIFREQDSTLFQESLNILMISCRFHNGCNITIN